MTKDEALDLALQALEWMVANDDTNEGDEPIDRLGGQSWNEYNAYWLDGLNNARAAITAIKQALAQPEARYTYGTPLLDAFTKDYEPAPVQEPVGFIESLKDAQPCCGQYETCYRACTPRGKFLGHSDAQRQWVGLTDEDVYPLANEHLHYQTEGYEVSGVYNFARAIEAKLKEKNT